MQHETTIQKAVAANSVVDHSTHAAFVQYYAEQSLTKATHERFATAKRLVSTVMKRLRRDSSPVDVADVGCGPGVQCILWALDGHRVNGLDISEELIELGRTRARSAGLTVDFRVGTATALPWERESMDVCLVPELLEHVVDWERCLDEFARVLRAGGILFLTTTNKLCPQQQEFNLPLYSWYPQWLKRRYERLAVSGRPQLANYARYPAVNWFTFYSLRRALHERGLDAVDRFDVAALQPHGRLGRAALALVRGIPPLRWLAHVLTPYTMVIAVKRGAQINSQLKGM